MNGFKKSLIAAALSSSALLLSGSAVASPSLTEFPLPNPDRGPAAIAPGPAQTVWFTETATNRVGVTTLNGSVSEFGGLSGPAYGLVQGPDGAMWATEPGAGKIARITASGAVSEFSAGLASSSEPDQITVGPDGNLWFTDAHNPGGIGRITPSGVITEFTAGLTANEQPDGITAGPDGNVWFTEAGNPGRIGRITPSGVITEFSAGLSVDNQPNQITAGPDGNLWFTEAGHPGRIGRITPGGVITEFSAGLTPSAEPAGITAGRDGNLWFAESHAPGRIGQITPAGVITELAIPSPGGSPQDITTGPDGNLWFTDAGHHGQIGTVVLGAPSAATAPATGIGATSATVAGSANPQGTPATYHFDWGLTSAYGQKAPAADAAVGSDSAAHQLSATLTGLLPGTTYHYRLVVTDCGGCQSGTSYGADMTFTTTTTSGTLGIGTGNPLAPAPEPAIGRTALAGVVSGTVRVRTPGSARLQTLSNARDIPVGSLVDATHGTVRVTTELNTSGRAQSATVWGGSFVIGQSAHRGMTTFSLAGTLGCPKVHRGFMTAMSLRRSARKPPRRSLWAQDNHGQYTTRGNNSVATVRGTNWETVDTCSGTLTFVKRGLVSVRDLHRHKTVLVHAGHSYLARS